MRHRFAVTNWLTAAYRVVQLVTRQAVRLGATLPKRVATGEVVAIGNNDLVHIGNAMDVLARAPARSCRSSSSRLLLLRTSVTLGLVVLDRRARCCCSPLGAAAQAAAAPQPRPARDDGRPRPTSPPTSSPGCGCCAGSAASGSSTTATSASRRRSAQAGVEVGRLQSVLDAAQVGAARHLRGRSSSGSARAFAVAGPDHGRRAGRVLRLRRVPHAAAAHRHRGDQQVDPRVRVRAPDLPRAGARAGGLRPRRPRRRTRPSTPTWSTSTAGCGSSTAG